MSVKITENVFSDSLLEKLFIFSRDGKQPTKTNFFSWGADVVGGSNAIFLFNLEEDLKKEVAQELIFKGILKKEPTAWKGNIFLMSRNSHIPWHHDGGYTFSITVYLNKVWDPNFGGFLLYEDGEDIKAYLPKYNSAVSFAPPLQHCTTLTSNFSPLRESLQIFIDDTVV